MNPALQKVMGLAVKAIWAALAAFLARVAEPLFKWIMFMALRGLVWLLHDGRAEGAVKELYRELKNSYGDYYDLDEPMGYSPETPYGLSLIHI